MNPPADDDWDFTVYRKKMMIIVENALQQTYQEAPGVKLNPLMQTACCESTW